MLHEWIVPVLAVVQVLVGFGIFLGMLRERSTRSRGVNDSLLVKRVNNLEDRVQSLREVRISERLSKLESSSVDYKFCNERHQRESGE